MLDTKVSELALCKDEMEELISRAKDHDVSKSEFDVYISILDKKRTIATIKKRIFSALRAKRKLSHLTKLRKNKLLNDIYVALRMNETMTREENDLLKSLEYNQLDNILSMIDDKYELDIGDNCLMKYLGAINDIDVIIFDDEFISILADYRTLEIKIAALEKDITALEKSSIDYSKTKAFYNCTLYEI